MGANTAPPANSGAELHFCFQSSRVKESVVNQTCVETPADYPRASY